mgnify:CR=1 FL=1
MHLNIQNIKLELIFSFKDLTQFFVIWEDAHKEVKTSHINYLNWTVEM